MVGSNQETKTGNTKCREVDEVQGEELNSTMA